LKQSGLLNLSQNGSVTVEMVQLSKKIEAITQELIDKSNEKE
jgi:PII-like signaling protein